MQNKLGCFRFGFSDFHAKLEDICLKKRRKQVAMIPPNQLSFDSLAFSENIQTLLNHLPITTHLIPVIKSNSYGIGVDKTLPLLKHERISHCALASATEAYQILNKYPHSKPFLLLNSLPEESEWIVKNRCDVVVSCQEMIYSFEKAAKKQNQQVNIHLHVNTGMNRLGCRSEDALEYARQIKRSPHLKLSGIMSHFSSADDPIYDPFTTSQVTLFDQLIHQLKEHKISPKWKHIANSGGVLRFSLPQYNTARTGLALYGLVPHSPLPLKNTLSLFTKIVGINTCKKGDLIGYGCTHQIPKKTARIAVLPLGYYHTLPLNMKDGAHVLAHGTPAPYVGRICMDLCMVDISGIPHAKIGDSVEVFGKKIHPMQFCKWINKTPYELITQIAPKFV